jgi:phosphoribosyl 1,2-cyclic phosphate phosphodiesterase
MLRHQVDSIDGILFTHEHNDHVIGLDDVRPFYFRQGNISIYANKRVVNALKQRFSYVFEVENKYPGAPTLDINYIENAPFKLQDQTLVTPVEVLHGQLPVLGFRIGDMAYITDAKTIPTAELEKLKGLKVLVLNALRHESHHSHFNLKEALEVVNYLQPEQTYFTHISHHLGFHNEVDQDLPEGVNLAYDNLQITI